MEQPIRTLAFVAAAVAVTTMTGCGERLVPSFGEPGSDTASPQRCYVTTIGPRTVKATITFYGYPDNTPPGKAIAHPVIHQRAGGDGMYCNPTTFATEKANNANVPYGTKIYVPFVKKYFGKVRVVLDPGPNLQVANAGPIYRNRPRPDGTCN